MADLRPGMEGPSGIEKPVKGDVVPESAPEGDNILVRPKGGVLATDCKTGCRITLYLEDQQCSSTPRDVTVRLTGRLCYRIVDATPCFGADKAINIYAAEDTTVLVEYIGRAGACYQRLQPRVNGTIVLWDSGAELLLPYESDTITLQANDRLQIYMNITGGCVNGDHDDHGGRAVWSIDGCPECSVCSPPITWTKRVVPVLKVLLTIIATATVATVAYTIKTQFPRKGLAAPTAVPVYPQKKDTEGKITKPEVIVPEEPPVRSPYRPNRLRRGRE